MATDVINSPQHYLHNKYESIDEMIRPNTHILLSVNKDNATIYYNDGTFSPTYADKKIEVKKSHNKNNEEITK